MPVDSPWLAMPLILPLLATALLLCVPRERERLRLAVMVAVCAAMLVAAVFLFQLVFRHGVMVLRVGNWPAPLGITLVADLFSAAMVLVSAVIGLAVAVFACGAGTAKFRGYFAPLYLALLLGVNGSFLTGDLFNLYVWFEVMLMSSFVLVALPGGRPQLEAAVKYLTLNFIASAFFLVALGVTYGMAGTLNMADLSVKLMALEEPNLVKSTAILFLIAFGVKAGIFPFYFWLPSSYPVLPAPVAAVFAGLLTKVGVYGCIRVFTLVYAGQQELLAKLLLPLGILTMVTGVLGAATQFFIPRILSFHIISQIGYMVVGLALFTRDALAATVFYIVHHILVKTNLFIVGSIVGRRLGSQWLEKTGGIYRDCPWLAVLFLVPALSLAGVPPLSGFIAKFALIREALALEYWTTVAVASAVGLLTLFSMVKIWNEAFWKSPPVAVAAARPVPWCMIGPAAALACATVVLGLAPAFFFDIAIEAAGQLMEPAAYIEAVLGNASILPE